MSFLFGKSPVISTSSKQKRHGITHKSTFEDVQRVLSRKQVGTGSFLPDPIVRKMEGLPSDMVGEIMQNVNLSVFWMMLNRYPEYNKLGVWAMRSRNDSENDLAEFFAKAVHGKHKLKYEFRFEDQRYDGMLKIFLVAEGQKHTDARNVHVTRNCLLYSILHENRGGFDHCLRLIQNISFAANVALNCVHWVYIFHKDKKPPKYGTRGEYFLHQIHNHATYVPTKEQTTEEQIDVLRIGFTPLPQSQCLMTGELEYIDAIYGDQATRDGGGFGRMYNEIETIRDIKENPNHIEHYHTYSFDNVVEWLDKNRTDLFTVRVISLDSLKKRLMLQFLVSGYEFVLLHQFVNEESMAKRWNFYKSTSRMCLYTQSDLALYYMIQFFEQKRILKYVEDYPLVIACTVLTTGGSLRKHFPLTFGFTRKIARREWRRVEFKRELRKEFELREKHLQKFQQYIGMI